MKKIFSLIMFLLLMTQTGHSNTNVPADLVSSKTTTFSKCLGSSDTNVQTSLNDIDACFGNIASGVTSVSNTDHSMIVSPTTGAVNAGVNWPNATINNETGINWSSFYPTSNPFNYITGNQTITWTGSGDLTGSASGKTTISPSLTLNTVNSNVGTFQGITVNGKGLITAAANQNYLASVTADAPLSGSGTAGSHLIFTNPGYITLGSLSGGTGITYNNSTGLITNSSPLSSLSLTTTGSSGASTWTQGTNTLNIPQYTGGTNYWTTGNVGINTTNNVGIGSTNPGQALDVNGVINTNKQVVINTNPVIPYAPACSSSRMPQSINSVWTEQACNVITANESPVSCGTNCYQQTMNLYTNSAINVNDTIVSFFDADFAGSGAVTNWAIVDNTLGSGTINTVNSGGNTTISKVSGSSFTSGWVGGYILISGTAYQITGYTNSTTITALGNAGTLTGTSYTAGNSFTKLGQSDFNVTYSDPGGTRVVYGNEFYVLGSAYALSSNYSATMAVKYTGTFGDFDSNLLQFRQSSGGASLGVDSSQPWTVGTSASGSSTCVPGVSGNFSTTCYLNTTTTTSVNPNDLILGVGNNVDWPMIGLSNSSIAIPCDGNGTTTPAFNAFGGNGTYPGFYYTLCLTAPSGTASFSSYQSSPSLGFNSTLLAFKPSNFTVGVPFSSSISGTQATLNAYLPFTNYPVAQLQTGENASDQIATLQFSDSNSSSSTLIPSDISVANDRIADSTELDTNLTQTNTLSAVYSEGQGGSLNGTPIAFSTQAAFLGGGVPSASALYISNGASQNIGIGSINPGSTIDVQGTIRAISNNVTTSVSTPGLSLLNSTASTGGVSQQNSPAFVLGGTSYQSSANKTVQIAQVVEPQSWGSTFWDLYSNINGAGWNKFFGLRTDNGSTSSLFLQPVGMDQDGVGQAFFGGFSLLNGGAATSGTQQYSPGVQFTTQGWSTTNSATYATTSGIFQKQTAGTTAPDGAISFAYGWTAGANNYNVSTSNDLLDLNFGPDTLGAAFNSSNTAGYTLTVKGNVGIGTTAPLNNLAVVGRVSIGAAATAGIAAPTNGLYVGGNVGIGTTSASSDVLMVNGGIQILGNLAGGTTGNVGIGTALTGAGATCDTTCNTAGKRCLFGFNKASVSIDPCSVSIVGDCACLPVT